jgi:hypothetical protein
MSLFELSQMNVARLKAPLDSPQLADFVGALDRINAVADRSPGFVWRLQDDSGNATALQPMGADIIVNMSVWKDAPSLQAYVYRSDHAGVMKRRREWFEKMDLHLVLWWVPRGHRPTPHEGIARLEMLRSRGPSSEAFTFGMLFPEPDQAEAATSTFDSPSPAT